MELEREKRLIERVQKDRDIEAFGEIYDQYYDRIFNYALGRTAQIEAAQDITSEAFYKALSNIGKFKWQNTSIIAWFYKITSNEINNYFRGSYKSHISLDSLINEYGFDASHEDQENPHQEITRKQDELDRHKDFYQLQECLQKLSPKHQEVIALRYFGKKSIVEIAEILDKPEGTIKSLISRAKDQLREEFEKNSNEMQPRSDISVLSSEDHKD